MIQNTKISNPIPYGISNIYRLKEIMTTAGPDELERLLSHYNIRLPAVTLDYLKAQQQVNNGLKGPYLERTVTALRHTGYFYLF